VLAVLSVVVFVLARLAPGDPVLARLGLGFRSDYPSQEMLEAERRDLGLDKPIPIQYFAWMGNMLTADLGIAIQSKKPVGPLVWEKFKRSLPLALSGVVMGVFLGITLGIVAGTRPFTWLDSIISTISLFGVAAPGFWVGLMLILFFAVKLDWLPTHGYAPAGESSIHFKYLILPSFTIAIGLVGSLTRYMRSGMLDVMTSDYIRTARAKGMLERVVILRHALKNAMLVVVTIIGLDFAAVLGGSIVTETVFQWPGMGLMLRNAVALRDYNVLQILTLLIAAVYVMINLAVDITYGYLDPRIRYE
jgi:ABC-type dipeptide/oligopeptide/nickel transport system permease component